MTRVLFVSTDIVGSAMAGPGIRAWELARSLARYHDVTLAAPRESDLTPDSFQLLTYATEHQDPVIAAAAAQADVLIIQGSMIEGYPGLLETTLPTAIDLYDPMLLEGLDLVAGHDRSAAQAQFARYLHIGDAQLRRGDFFFCATDRQRDYWLGALTAIGRITPDLLSSSDRDLRDVIELVPSGIPELPPAAQAPVLRGVHPAIRANDIILLWAGGLWDWFEPDLLVRAMAQLSVERPRLKLVFFGGSRPSADGKPFRTRTYARTRALASELEVLDRSVVFIEEWVPYARRAAFLSEADVGVSAHRPGIETRFAFRTRLLDYIWARVPVVCSSGDSVGEEIAQAGGALLVMPGDLGGWIAALRQIADDGDLRARCRTAIGQLAQRYTWDALARPLVRFCDRPRRAPAPAGGPHEQITALSQALVERDTYIRHLEFEYHQAVTQAQRLDLALRRSPQSRARRAGAWLWQRTRTLRRRP
jgi:glycosyltransferase involved in cell wall biosynthesis